MALLPIGHLKRLILLKTVKGIALVAFPRDRISDFDVVYSICAIPIKSKDNILPLKRHFPPNLLIYPGTAVSGMKSA